MCVHSQYSSQQCLILSACNELRKRGATFFFLRPLSPKWPMTRKSLREHLVTLHPPFYVAFTNAIYLNNRERCFFVLSRAWDKEKILSPNEKSNLRPSDSALRCSTTETQRLHCEYGLLRSSHDTRPAHC